MGEEKNTRKGKRNIIIALLLILLACIIIIGFTLAFFSDFVTGGTTATAGTLDLVAGTTSITRYYTKNGTESSDSGTTIANLNPGDIIEVDMSVTNAGNKSAWLKEFLTITLGENYAGNIPDTTGLDWTNAVDAFEIYPASATNASIRDGTAVPITTDVTATNTVLALEPASGTTIINGTGAGAETETGGVSSFTSDYKIYFNAASNNEYQGISLSVVDKVEAMQFRNNPTPVWSNVTSAEFTLVQT